MQKLKSINWKKLIRNKYLIISAIIILIFMLIFALRRGSSVKIESSVASIGQVLEKVDVTGKISPLEKADLSFDTGGSIAKVYVKVGDKVTKGQILASLDNADAVASLASAQAKLDDITRALRPEELQVEKARVESAKASHENAKSSAINASRDGLVKAQSSLVNYADTFFNNPQSANPTIKISTQSNTIQTRLNFDRVSVSEALTNWQNDLDRATSSDSASTILSNSNRYLSIVKNFMDNLSIEVNLLSPGNSGFSQSVIDAYVTVMNTAETTLNQAISTVTTAKTSLELAQNSYYEINSSYILKNSGSSDQAVRAQQATVDSLRAVVDKGRIYSPIDGIVTKADPREGEYTSPGVPGFAVQGEGIYKIEAYIAEADIAKVSVGNSAEITLDAYGSGVIFDAKVVFINPAETVIEGVPTYKVTLHFMNTDPRIRSGMTANIEILTRSRENVVSVPTRSIIDVSGVKNVRVLNNDGVTFVNVPVQVGLRGYNGITEIISGIKEGDKVVTYTK